MALARFLLEWRLYQQAKVHLDVLERLVRERTLALETKCINDGRTIRSHLDIAYCRPR
jgi:hypothetical protein